MKLDIFQKIDIEYCQRKILDGMHQILCLGKSFKGFTSSEVLENDNDKSW